MTTKNLKKSEIYKIIRENQLELHSESVMSATLEESYNQNILREFKDNFIKQNINAKHYFTRFLFMTGNFNSRKLPFSKCKAFEINETEPQIKKIPNLFDFSGKLDNKLGETFLDLDEEYVLDSLLIDIITYSLIPSLFLMFLEDDTFKSFCKFIEYIKDNYRDNTNDRNLHFQFSRSIFASPIFIKFIRKVMHDILQPIYGIETSSISITLIQNSILNSFKENINKIPSFIQEFLLKMKDTFNFLKECLFNQLIKNPELFLVIDLNTISQAKMNQFRNSLMLIFDDTLINSISDLIENNENSENAIFKPEKYEAELTQLRNDIMIIDCIDCKLIDIISRHIEEEEEINSDFIFTEFSNKKYTIYRSVFQIDFSEEIGEFLERTITKSTDPWMNFRYLLKNSPPLPSNYVFKNDIEINTKSFYELFASLLVDNCDPNTIISARVSFDIFMEKLKDNDLSSDFKKKMESLVTSHDEQDIVMETISKFKKEFLHLTEILNNSIDLNKNLFLAYLIDCYDIDSGEKDLPSIPIKPLQLVSDPIKYVNDYEKYFSIQSTKCMNLFGDPCTHALRSHFYQNIDYYSYLSLRPELHKFDEVASEACQKCLVKNFTQPNIQKICKKVKNMEFFTDSFNKLKHAFEINGDLITKARVISNSMYQLIVTCLDFTGESGADYISPLILYSLSAANPPNIISNMVFLYEYIYFNNTRLWGLIDQFQPWLECLDKQILINYQIFQDFPLSKLARTRTKRVELFITGNDDDLIANAVAQVRSIFTGKPKNEKDINFILTNIKSSPKENIICVNEGTTTLNTLSMPYFIEVDINFRSYLFEFTNIKNKHYDYRIAVFCYKSGVFSIKNNIKKFTDAVSKYNINKWIVAEDKLDKPSDEQYIEISQILNTVYITLKKEFLN